MTKKESDKIDFVLFCMTIASTRGADKTDMLNAFAYDIHLIRKGKNPTEAKKLVNFEKGELA